MNNQALLSGVADNRPALGEILRQIAPGISTATGAAFFRSLVQQLAGTLKVDFAFVGELTANDQVQTTAVFARNDWIANFTYPLEGTPCAQIVAKKACCFPSGVWRQFPQDPWLAKEAIESYLGVPLVDSHGHCLGLMAVLDRRPLSNIETVEATLRIFATRAQAELERKRVEEALRQSEEWNRHIIDAVPGGIVIVAPDDTILEANPGAARILGMTLEEIRTHKAGEFCAASIHEDGTSCSADDYPIGTCYRTGQAQPEQVIGMRRSDGQYTWVVRTIVPLHTPGTDHIAAVLVTFFDITEHKRRKESLRKSEEFHRLIAEIAADYAYSCRVDPDGSIHMDALTDGFVGVTGYTLEEAESQGGWATLIHPDDLPQAVERLQDLLAGRGGDFELRIRTKAGQTRWIHYTTKPLWNDREKRVDRLVGAVQDITERKLAEERQQMLSRRLLEVQEEERRHLARELHDQVGQVLTGIKMALERSRQPGRMEQSVNDAQNMVRELTALVRNLSLGLRPSMLDDLGLLPALVWLVERAQKQTGLKVRLSHRHLQGRFPAPVETAAFRIIQEALTNVARHAAATEAEVRVWCDPGKLKLRVADQGMGFDPKKKPSSATGGLSGMQERAALLGGRFLLESQLDAGTCITVELPIPELPAATQD